MIELEAPNNLSELYLARGAEVERLRPILQGGVFAQVEIPGLELGTGLVMILTHPCSMRTAGGALRPRLAVARVRTYESLPAEAWPNGHYRVLPLPNLRPDHHDESLAADFELIGTVSSASLDVGRRIACLSDYGLTVLQQRRVHHDTRVVVELDVLHEQAAPNLEEAELLQEWLEGLVADPESATQVAQQTSAFDTFLSAGGDELRGLLLEPVTRSAVRKRVRSEIRNRSVGGTG